MIELGFEPISEEEEAEPLIDFNDLDYECQLAIQIFNILPDKIEGMNGMWLGKEWGGISDIMDIYSVEDRKEMLELLLSCRNIYFEYYEDRRKEESRKNNKIR